MYVLPWALEDTSESMVSVWKVFPERTGCWVASSKWILIVIDFNVKSNNRDRTSVLTVSVPPTGQ